jgi:uncharacterized protein (TIRG00374 family)
MISYTVGMISMIPMDLGIRDTSVVLLLLNLGVPNEVAISTALVQRILTTGLNIVLGASSASVLGVKLFNGKDSIN